MIRTVSKGYSPYRTKGAVVRVLGPGGGAADRRPDQRCRTCLFKWRPRACFPGKGAGLFL